MTMRLIHGDNLAWLRSCPDNYYHAVASDAPFGLAFMAEEWDAPATRETRTRGFTPSGLGRPTPLPNHAPAAAYGNANPTCDRCGGRARGAKKCTCDAPMWRVKGLPVGEGASDAEMTWARNKRTEAAANIRANYRRWTHELYRVCRPGAYILIKGGARTYHHLATAIEEAGFLVKDMVTTLKGGGMAKVGYVSKRPDASEELRAAWEGWAGSLAPGQEPMVLAQKPCTGTITANLARWGCGALHVDAARISFASATDKARAKPAGRATSKPTGSVGAEPDVGRNLERATFTATQHEAGRWPKNTALVHDTRCVVVDPDTRACVPACPVRVLDATHPGVAAYFGGLEGEAAWLPAFYGNKASPAERNAGLAPPERTNPHPTVTPLTLARWKIALLTPPGGRVLDLFLGSGSYAVAAYALPVHFDGVEQRADYFAVACARVQHAGADIEIVRLPVDGSRDP